MKLRVKDAHSDHEGTVEAATLNSHDNIKLIILWDSGVMGKASPGDVKFLGYRTPIGLFGQ